ncbi:hypothetical protein M0R72_09775 [Candidatus Pacearchaeota archaeon]|jgi:hypothetical protein|nr:hypothetical protein [Candidatus Pacearchaeota archaeon]
MKINFKKVSAIATSALMVGLSVGTAAAANYPQPFVVGSSANVAVVYGTGSGVSSLDLVQAGNIQSNLQSYMGASTGSSAVSTSGETVSLDTNADRIWLNTSLNAVKSTITEDDLPTVLADYSFSGDVTSKITSTITLQAGAAAGGENTGKVIFAKQPESSDDPSIAISLGTAYNSYPLYKASATMAAINFTSADSEGEEIELFGQTFTIAAETDATNIVLLKDAEKVTLSVPSNPSATVTVEGSEYTIRLITASSTSANIEVTNSAGVSASKEVNEAASKKINGLDVAVTTATSSSLESVGESASIIVGSQKLTLTDNSIVTVGENDDPIDGTYVDITGTNNADVTEIALYVFRPDSTEDAILPGESFVDPVFGSFKLDFAGLSSNLDDTGREMVSVQNSGDATMSITMTDDAGNSKTFDFAHNESSQWRLADNSNYSIAVREGANLSYAAGQAKYVVVGNEDYGHMLELYDVYNQTTGTSSVTNDRVKFRDVMSGDTYETSFSSTEGSGTLDVDGKRYTVTFVGTGEDAGVRIKYPTSESNVGEYIVFPTIETANGGLVSLYEPQTLALANYDGAQNNVSKLWLPDGDGYTGVTLTYNGTNGGTWNITHGTTVETLNTSVVTSYVDFTIGQLVYNMTGSATLNSSILYLTNPEATANIVEPSVVLFEGKDDDTYYHAVVVQTEPNDASMGTSTNGVGVHDVLFSSDKYHASATKASDSDFTEDIDWFGTLTTIDASDSDQKTVEISLPKSQVYAQIYLGEIGSSISGGSSSTAGAQLGDILVKDSEVSSVSSKNLIVVGGSCVNSAAAKLLGAACGADFTEKTGVGSGQFLIQSFGDAYSTGKIAVVVAGFEAADTVNAATFLRTQTVDTTASKKYKGSSATSAELVTTTA